MKDQNVGWFLVFALMTAISVHFQWYGAAAFYGLSTIAAIEGL